MRSGKGFEMDRAMAEQLASEAHNEVIRGSAIADVVAERVRQYMHEGWTPEHDDQEHQNFELGKAAAAYLGHAVNKDATRKAHAARSFPPGIWPWHRDWWKPTTRRRDLVKAAALIIAEIERLDRAAAKSQPTL